MNSQTQYIKRTLKQMPKQKYTIKVAGEEVEFVLRKSLGTRNLSLRLDHSKRLYISAPRLMSTKRIVEFLEEKQNWIKKNLQKIEEMNQEKAASKKSFTHGEDFVLLGEKYKLDIQLTPKKRPKAYFECGDEGANRLILEIHEDTPFRDIPELGRKAIEKLYREYARAHFMERLSTINKTHYRYRYGDVRIKNQRTLFGSCSSKGNLNFNWRVIMAPEGVVDYLMTHELCHLKEMNHSKKFWSLVERACPQYKTHRKWLKSKGHTLMI